MSENTQENKKSVGNETLNMFTEEFAATTIPVYINSLKKEVNFREVSVKEQKEISKTMIQNETRKDIVYDAQCKMINQMCTDKSFDIYELTEFDRIRILMEIYSSNYFQNTITYKCPECGVENSYVIDFNKILEKFNSFDLEDVSFKMEDKNRVYNFILNYPSVRNVSNFYRNYMKKYKNVSKKDQDMLDNLGNIEYVNLFIKQIELINKRTPDQKKVADLRIMSFEEVEQLLAMFPQSVLFDDEKGVIKNITTQFIDRINSVFQYEKCANCGHQTEQGMGSLIDFF